MQLFTNTNTKGNKTYKTQANAINANNPEALEKFRWIMASTPEGRYHIVFIGQEATQYAVDNRQFIAS